MLSNSAFLFPLFAVFLPFAIVALGLWRVFLKADQPGWAAIIPFYNFYVLCKVAKKPVWFLLLLFVPIANFYAIFSIWNGVSKNFGKGLGFTLGLIFLPYIFLLVLGFDESSYGDQSPPTTGLQFLQIVLVAGVVAFVFIGAVGILGVIAIPNFQKFKGKAQQSEAKVALAQLYTAQKAFHVEYGFYHTDLEALKMTQSNLQSYRIGFVNPSVLDSEILATLGELQLDPAKMQVIPAGRTPASHVDLGNYCSDCTATKDTFKAVAVGFINGKADVWTINESKQLKNIQWEEK